jgi:hypothetical protein
MAPFCGLPTRSTWSPRVALPKVEEGRVLYL